jgi:hypothetical protein
VSLAAIRIPELDAATPSSPKLFIHEGSRQALERKIRTAYQGKAVVLSITDNRQNIVTQSIQSGVLFVRLHHMFLDAPPAVMDALVRYLVNWDRDSDLVVGQYIESNGARLARSRPQYDAKGDVHDLIEIYESLNERYFGGKVHSLIAWGRYTPRKPGSVRKTIRLGSYVQLEELIRIHPVLDQTWVPRYFISFVIYHEMLHHVFPSAGEDERRILHSPEFLERERQFKWYTRATEWESKNLKRLLRSG